MHQLVGQRSESDNCNLIGIDWQLNTEKSQLFPCLLNISSTHQILLYKRNNHQQIVISMGKLTSHKLGMQFDSSK